MREVELVAATEERVLWEAEEEVSEREIWRARVRASLSRAKASLIHADFVRCIHGSSTEQFSAMLIVRSISLSSASREASQRIRIVGVLVFGAPGGGGGFNRGVRRPRVLQASALDNGGSCRSRRVHSLSPPLNLFRRRIVTLTVRPRHPWDPRAGS